MRKVTCGGANSLDNYIACKVDLELNECRVAKNGCLYVSYRVKR